MGHGARNMFATHNDSTRPVRSPGLREGFVGYWAGNGRRAETRVGMEYEERVK